MPVNNQYLEQRRLGWYCVVEVPPLLRKQLGRRLRRSLKTRDLNIARARRWAVVKDLKAAIEAARSGATAADTLTEEALIWRDELERGDNGPDDDRPLLLGDRAEEIAAERGEEAAGLFVQIARGEATPVNQMVDRWLSERRYTERTVGDHRRAVELLRGWGGQLVSIEEISKRKAGDFVSEVLLSGKLAGKTVNKYLSSLSSYWKWLGKKGYAKENPWEEQGVPKQQQRGQEGEAAVERPFTNAEVRTLLDAAPDGVLRDLMSIGALSGMRIEEICRLAVRDAVDGAFNIRRSKTAAGIRSVPIHPDLVPIVARRSADKKADEFLFDELNASGPGGERSMAVSKRFGRFRQTVKVHEKADGKRRSLVNFHSFRRWFITKAEEAGQPPWTIEAVVGHKREGMSLGVYSGGPSVEQLRGCVEAVRLPGPAVAG